MYKERIVTDKLKRLAEHFPCVVISGARQVGKSTLLKHLFPDHELVVFDPSIDVGNARKDPELFFSNHSGALILDEIQYAPELVSVIKRLIDLDRVSGKFIMTGSQQWSVMKTISESLAGRSVFLDLEGFSLSEITESGTTNHWLHRWLKDPQEFVERVPELVPVTRTFFEQLWRGWLPETDQLPIDLIPAFYAAYFRTYLERDVRLLGQVDDWQQFGRFVQLLAALTAQEINYSKVGRDIGITPQTARRWMAMILTTFQWYEVPAYSGNATKRISGKPKGYFADSGLACHLQRISSPGTLEGHPQTGFLFESAVFAEIRKLITTENLVPYMYHWRTHGGAEVDLILERDNRFYPIEMKLTASPSRAHTRGIQAFRETYPHLNIAPGLIITPSLQGHTVQKISEYDYAISWMLR